MLAVDSDILWRPAPPQSGGQAARQCETIDGRGAPFAATLDADEISTPSLRAELGSADAAPPGGGITVPYRGSEGSAVTRLQQRLVAAGYPMPLDDAFGPATELAVTHLQTTARLESDGIVGVATGTALQPAAVVAPAPVSGGEP